MAKINTTEGAVQYDHSMDFAVEFFSKSGSLYATKTKKSVYGNETTALELFKNVWISGNKEVAMKLLFWLRDAKNGSGNRSGFRECLKWLVETDPMWVKANLHLIPEYGRWDDLRTLFGTVIENDVSKLWANAIIEKNVLSAKWADRSDKAILKYLRSEKKVKDIGEFRRLLANIRKAQIPEHKMCSNQWNEIEYSKVPSVAMSRYNKAFKKHDFDRFEIFKTKVEKGEAKINAGVVFPHDLVRLIKNGGDEQIADLQFDAMPNFLNTDQRVMTLVDSSGSMSTVVGGTIEAYDVSTSLGLYCSDRLGKDNPFYRKFMEFESESKLTDWSGKKFSAAYDREGIFNGACGSTRIDKALDSILNFAKMFKATNDQIPNVLLIISDMQFHQGVNNGSGTEVNNCIQKWVDVGYSRPKIVYWNVAGCQGSPELSDSKDVGLVSGFSPSILTAIFSGTDFSPKGIMNRAIEKYKIVTPA